MCDDLFVQSFCHSCEVRVCGLRCHVAVIVIHIPCVLTRDTTDRQGRMKKEKGKVGPSQRRVLDIVTGPPRQLGREISRLLQRCSRRIGRREPARSIQLPTRGRNKEASSKRHGPHRPSRSLGIEGGRGVPRHARHAGVGTAGRRRRRGRPRGGRHLDLDGLERRRHDGLRVPLALAHLVGLGLGFGFGFGFGF